MTNRLTTQKGNIVSGNLAGRDVNVRQESEPRTTMRALTQRFREEIQEDEPLSEAIDSLKYFLDPSVPAASFDLEQKLLAAERDDDLLEATALKELFAKKLARHELSPAAQEIFAWALGHMQVSFQVHVRPMIASGKPPEAIDRVVLEKVIQPTIVALEDNVLILNYQELRGMLYYLTGNCHVEWNTRA